MRDQYGREITYLRLSVTELCNLRCRYCMPDEGIAKREHGEILTEDEMVAVVEAAASLGVRKLRITGGEPLVKKNILSICRRAAAVEGISEVCLTTNATLLERLAQPLRQAGVDRLNISLDTLDAEKYARITRRGSLSDALAGIRAAQEAGFSRVKLNAVLVGGFNDDEIPALAALTREYDVDVRFIELMPMGENGVFGREAYLPCDAVLRRLPELLPEETEGVADLYRLPGARGRVGLIRPVSRHFCDGCNRIRVTADGKIKPCLHSNQELSVKGLDGEAMREVLRRAVWEKPRMHDTLSATQHSGAQRAMNRIGG